MLGWLLKHLFADNLDSCPNCGGGNDKLVRAVLHHMEKHLTDSEGIEPTQAQADFRLEEAKRLLSQTTLSLERTAKECGYGDTKRLTANFKKATLIT
ncbi:MAG: AraC family transcriptional regulator [Polyangiaceae bacterium]|nr:AraC family transcriptional regulator [Polyangiaceae bacterium]